MADAPPGAARSLSIEELSQLREKTDAVALLLQKRLAEHLETIRPLLAPRWLLGRHVTGGEGDSLPGSDRAFEALKAEYARTCGKPFSLPKDVEEDPISIDGRIDLHPWEYRQAVGEEGKLITMTSPLRWVVSYRSGYAPSQLRDHLVERQSLRRDDARRFLLSARALRHNLEKHDAIGRLLADLRYEIQVEPYDGLGELPVVSIASCVPSFRPADAVILAATRFSGVPAFIEVVDADAVRALGDPVREQIQQILG
jgi:hypothetical protein